MGDRCVDVDECVEQQGLCPRPGTCKNTHGSFKCVCPRGYRLDESGTFCIDRNECEEDGGSDYYFSQMSVMMTAMVWMHGVYNQGLSDRL